MSLTQGGVHFIICGDFFGLESASAKNTGICLFGSGVTLPKWTSSEDIRKIHTKIAYKL